MTYIHIYQGDVTEGNTDGTLVSEDGAQTDPIRVTLNKEENEDKTLKLAIRCEEGYKTAGNTTISFTGTTASMWQVSEQNDSGFSDTLEISDSIGATNKTFYVKAISDSSENAQADTSVAIVVNYTIMVA